MSFEMSLIEPAKSNEASALPALSFPLKSVQTRQQNIARSPRITALDMCPAPTKVPVDAGGHGKHNGEDVQNDVERGIHGFLLHQAKGFGELVGVDVG